MPDPIIVNWTLANEDARALHDALRSAARISDACLVVWTGAEPSPLGALPDVAVKNQVHRHYWAWRNDYAAARNEALDVAWGLFVEPTPDAWSMMTDSDETVICPDPAAFRAWLAALPASVAVVLVHHCDGTHTRERFFRLPSRYRFSGHTHEAYLCPEDEQAIAPRELIQWSELPKTREQLRAKFSRDAEMLYADIEANPSNGAAHYYLGDSLRNLALYAREDGEEEKARALFMVAIDVFREHHRIDTTSGCAWHEGTAFSCYRAAECYLALGQPNRAIDCAVAGLALDAGIAELYWIAAVASWQEGRVEQARAWAEGALAHGAGSESERRRKGFRVVQGLDAGPRAVLEAVRKAGG